MPTDTERLDWLANKDGWATGLVNDDFGHWAVVCDGTQNVPENIPGEIWTTFFIKAEDWHDDIRSAIDAAMTA